MWQAWFMVLTAFALLGVALRLRGRWVRHRALQRVPEADRVRALYGIGLRVLVEGSSSLAGMKRGRLNKTRGDLVVSEHAVLLVCNRGVLLERRRRDHGPRWALRRTGPGRMVLEGDLADSSSSKARFRVEFAHVESASDWATLLAEYAPEAYGSSQ